MLLQHLHEALGDALRQDDWNLRTDPDELDVLDGAQARQQPIELVVADAERIAAGEQDIAHLGVRLEIAEGLLPLPRGELVFAAGITHEARTRAVAAIGRTRPRCQEQYAVRIAMHYAGNDRVVVFAQRIVGLPRDTDVLVARHDV